MIVVNESFCFTPHSILTTEISNRALRKYADGFEIAKRLGGELPIILDTNILLGYYGMSQNEKAKLLEFIQSYKHRIYITKQVEQEYLRNRVSSIKKDFFSPLNKIADDFSTLRTEITGKFQHFRDHKKKMLSQDYPLVWEGLKRIEDEIKAILNDDSFYNDLVTQVGATTHNNKNIVIIDELLDLISTLKTTEQLSEDELGFIKDHFEKLMVEYSLAKENVKWKSALPGCGDQKEDASGDFVIFHELLKFMKMQNTGCIFLTNDVTKGDWLQMDKNPHNHYIEQAYRLTENVVYIIHAEQTLPTISFENIHKQAKAEPIEIQNVDNQTWLESTIVTLDTAKGFGFIMHPKENLYFNRSEFDGNFNELQKNDIVVFETGKNFEGNVIAKNVRKAIYSFEIPISAIKKEKVSHVNHLRGIGFISNQPENLYFHQAFMASSHDFQNLKEGDEVEFIEGRNHEGEVIARLVRPIKILEAIE